METRRNRSAEKEPPAIAFLRGFLQNPKEVASVVPSSPFLTRRVLNCGRVAEAPAIVELGPGSGVLTREILRHMPRDGRLTAVEINADFVRLLRREFDDSRLHVYQGDAADLERAFDGQGLESADLLISGVPFSTMAADQGRQTLAAIRRVLKPGGRFVAYQVRDHVRRMAEPIFGPAEVYTELWNIPPMRIYVWQLSA